MLQTRDHASGLMRGLRSVVLANFDEGQIEALLRPILKIDNDTELETLALTAWKNFRSPPFLTHLWADVLSGQKGRYDAMLALQNIVTKAEDHLFHPFLDNLDNVTRAALRSATMGTAATIDALPLSAFARLCLRDSGLFDINGLGAQASIDFASPWIRSRLAIALATRG